MRLDIGALQLFPSFWPSLAFCRSGDARAGLQEARAPQCPGSVTVGYCYMYIWLRSHIHCPCSVLIFVFYNFHSASLIFFCHVLDYILLVLSLLPLWSCLFSYQCVLLLLWLVPWSGSCVILCNRGFFLFPLCTFHVSIPEGGQWWPKAREERQHPVSAMVTLQVI